MSKNHKIEPLFYGSIKKDTNGNNVPLPDNFKVFTKYLNERFKPGDKFKLVLKKHYQKRTQGKDHEPGNQNGYYWTVVIPILGEYFGYLPWEMHEVLRPMFFYREHPKHPGIKQPISSTEYDRVEWENKMQEIRVWALTTYEVVIPLPNEVDSKV